MIRSAVGGDDHLLMSDVPARKQQRDKLPRMHHDLDFMGAILLRVTTVSGTAVVLKTLEGRKLSGDRVSAPYGHDVTSLFP